VEWGAKNAITSSSSPAAGAEADVAALSPEGEPGAISRGRRVGQKEVPKVPFCSCR